MIRFFKSHNLQLSRRFHQPVVDAAHDDVFPPLKHLSVKAEAGRIRRFFRAASSRVVFVTKDEVR